MSECIDCKEIQERDRLEMWKNPELFTSVIPRKCDSCKKQSDYKYCKDR